MAVLRPYIGAAVLMGVFGGLLSLGGPQDRYVWAKALHLIAMVSWFAGIFYLPRLFVYHAMVEDDDTRGHERFVVMERKLYRFVTPFMLLTVFFGTWMLAEVKFSYLQGQGWMHAKLLLVALLIAYHYWMGAIGKRLREPGKARDHKFYRVINELPVLVLFAVVIFVVVKPF